MFGIEDEGKETDLLQLKASKIIAHIINKVNIQRKENHLTFKKAYIAKNLYDILVASKFYTKVGNREFVNGMTIEIVCDQTFEDGRIKMYPETPIIDFTLIEETNEDAN